MKSNRPPFPKNGEMLECVGGPKDGERLPTFGSREVHIPLPQPIRIVAYEDPPPIAPAFRVGVYEVTLMGRAYGEGVELFYVLKWLDERS